MESYSALLVLCVGNSPVTGELPTQRPVIRSFGVFFDLRPNKWFSKQSWCWWFETPSRSLWRHYDDFEAMRYIILSDGMDEKLHISSEIWESTQLYYRGTYQISKRCDDFNTQSLSVLTRFGGKRPSTWGTGAQLWWDEKDVRPPTVWYIHRLWYKLTHQQYSNASSHQAETLYECHFDERKILCCLGIVLRKQLTTNAMYIH